MAILDFYLKLCDKMELCNNAPNIRYIPCLRLSVMTIMLFRHMTVVT